MSLAFKDRANCDGPGDSTEENHNFCRRSILQQGFWRRNTGLGIHVSPMHENYSLRTLANKAVVSDWRAVCDWNNPHQTGLDDLCFHRWEVDTPYTRLEGSRVWLSTITVGNVVRLSGVAEFIMHCVSRETTKCYFCFFPFFLSFLSFFPSFFFSFLSSFLSFFFFFEKERKIVVELKVAISV